MAADHHTNWTLSGQPPQMILSSHDQNISNEDDLWRAIKSEALLPFKDHASLICLGAVWHTQHQWHQRKPTDVYTLSDGLESYAQRLNALIPHRQDAWILATQLRNCLDEHIGALSPLELIARIAVESRRLLQQVHHYEKLILNLLQQLSFPFDGNWDFSSPLWLNHEQGPLVLPAWRVHEDGSTLISKHCIETIPAIEKWTVVTPWNWAPATRRYPFTAQSLWVPGPKIKQFLCAQGMISDPDQLTSLFGK